MTMRRLGPASVALSVTFLLGAARATAAAAQVCAPASPPLALVPSDPTDPYALPSEAPEALADAHLGVGHVHHDPQDTPTGPPGDLGWLAQAVLPLSERPGEKPTLWLAHGWIVGEGRDPQPLTYGDLLETGYEEPSFVVLERRDGWLRIRYAAGDPESHSAWTPECALDASPAPLVFAPWSEWLLGEERGPLFVRDGAPLALHSEPSATSEALATVTADDMLEPHEIRGEWMRVTLVQPSDFCQPEVAATRREGWVRWLREDGRGPRLWYFTRGC